MAEPPLFCCCQFVDRHGRTSHLLDMSFCDAYTHGWNGTMLHECCSDLDDRLRLPQYNGAVYLGVEGALPLLLLPAAAAAACRGPLHTAALLLLALPLLAAFHRRALRHRRRSRFFVSWCAASLFYCEAAFTLLVGEHYAFGWWLLTSLGHVSALLCASAVRLPPGGEEAAPSRAECEGLTAGEAEREAGRGAPLAAGRVTCPLCGHSVPGYDHHCIYLDACVGAHNRGYFLRGLLLSWATMVIQTALTADRALHQPGGRTWGLEAACASYGLVLVLACTALLAEQLWLLGHGLTSYEARCLRRQGKQLPPWIGCGRWVQHLRSLLLSGHNHPTTFP
ncbi:hypothetical protein AB1Y20_001931 [Prymnesium parvum]|uniref:Palmitoyltransferase n=1 Tax=Prymnesium parvum TaxID=97485 RepID=A0AB34J7J3_PRYPA